MHLHPDSVLPLVQLKSARTARDPKVPMMAACAAGQFALASNDDSPPVALIYGLPGGELEIEFEHPQSLTNILTRELRILMP
jgi:hypothetical protein